MARLDIAMRSIYGIGTTDDKRDKYTMGLGVDANDASDMTLVKEYWERPTKEYPNGRYAVVVGSELAEIKDNPYGELPYVQFTWFPRPGSAFSDGGVTALIPLQKQLNMLHSQLLTNVKKTVNSPWIVQRGTVDNQSFNDASGVIIEYDQTKGPMQVIPPRRAEAPNVVTQILMSIQSIESQMDQLSGFPLAARGQQMENRQSGTMIQAMRNASEESRKPLLSRYRESLTTLGKLLMRITRSFVTEDQLIPVVARDGMVMLEEFTTRDIENGYDLYITAGDGYPDDPAGRTDVLLSLSRTGMFDMKDRKTRQLFVNALPYGDIQSIYDNGQTAERVRIFGENMKMIKGTDVMVKAYDLHLDHAERHTTFMRSPEAQRVFTTNPDIEQLIQDHVNEHLSALGANGAQVPELAPELQTNQNAATLNPMGMDGASSTTPVPDMSSPMASADTMSPGGTNGAEAQALQAMLASLQAGPKA